MHKEKLFYIFVIV